MPKLYRGLSYALAKDIVEGKGEITESSSGEFGKGSYYWLDDLPAGVISALQYYGQKEGGWAVLEISVGSGDMKGLRTLNFRQGKPKDFDFSTQTASKNVSVSQFGNVEVKMNFQEFREVNADPEGHYLTGEKNNLSWPNYPIIAGPTVAAPKEVSLTQIKFSGEAIAVLNAAKKKVVVHGAKLSDKSFQTVRSWTLEKRKPIFSKYFEGKEDVTLVF